MSILAVFGANLRLLCDRRGAQSGTARALGMSRAQFQRFLRGESFPKPDQLKIICDRFAVDARILTEPLDARLLAAMRGGAASGPADRPVDAAMAEAIAYACATQDYFEYSEEFPDGLYLVWRKSMSQTGKMACTLMQVKTLTRARVVRGFDLRSMYRDHAQGADPAPREFRGILHRQQFGFSVIFYHARPTKVLSQTFLTALGSVRSGLLLFGFTTLGRSEHPGLNRLSRCVWQRIEPTWPAAIAAGRRQGLMDEAEVPPNIWPLLSAPLK